MHKWESDVQELDEEPNPSKILASSGLLGQKKGYTRDSSKDEREQLSYNTIYSESAECYLQPTGGNFANYSGGEMYLQRGV